MIRSNTEISSDNELMDLRLVILRAISAVWDDDHNSSRFKKIANSNKTHAKSLREYLTTCSHRQLLDYFNDEFHYHAPFANFTIAFIHATATWNLYGNHEWSKPQDETITLCLPACEKDWDDYQKAERLMEYYTYFPNFFGSAKSAGVGEEAAFKAESMAAANSLSGRIDLSGNNYDLGVSEDSFFGFGAVVSKLIAIAWANDEFKSIINYDEKDESTTDEQYYADVINILREHQNFEVPWAFNIKFVFSKTFKESASHCEDDRDVNRLSFWIKEGEKKTAQWRWRDNSETALIRNMVSLEIPNTPQEKQANISLALAKYNAIGPAYPFTCS